MIQIEHFSNIITEYWNLYIGDETELFWDLDSLANRLLEIKREIDKNLENILKEKEYRYKLCM